MTQRSWRWEVTVVVLSFSMVGIVQGQTIDLSVNTEGSLHGAFFQQYNPDPSTGTGKFEPFVRLQGNGIEVGYNTDGAEEFQTKSGTWTHSITLDDIPVVEEKGTSYREFLLDTDQDGGPGRMLSLDELIISLESAGNLTGYPSNPGENFGGPVVYHLDNGGDHWIKMDARLFGPGSGTGDVRVLIPESYFAQALQIEPTYDHVYLYSSFGENIEANDGFEEWGVNGIIPEPAAALLLGLGGVFLRRRRNN